MRWQMLWLIKEQSKFSSCIFLYCFKFGKSGVEPVEWFVSPGPVRFQRLVQLLGAAEGHGAWNLAKPEVFTSLCMCV